ncbi:MAG: excinuclease ABC subunit UvrA [Alphaproteobacteria bacterium]|nr:excinuclease ABC subunit UvrA [Alphaproteobacteria bacterium]
MKHIKIRGAREHNLKNIDLDIPKNTLTVITGVSGSGKSSLAFDTLYAEGQRRYIESLSAYARQFLDQQKKPEIDSIEGLSPAISIEQKTTSKNPRSTVGTITEIYDYFRLLWARAGIAYSPATGLPIEALTTKQMAENVLKEFKKDDKLYIEAPIAKQRKGTFKKEFQNLIAQGFMRFRINGQDVLSEDLPDLDKNKKHTISVVVDRLVLKDSLEPRFFQSLETALKIGDGLTEVRNIKTDAILLLSEKYACPVSGFTLDEIEPRLFSFNAPAGACPSCSGLGFRYEMAPDLIIPDESKSIRGGAIAPFSRGGMITQYEYLIESVCRVYKIPMSKAWSSLSEDQKKVLLFGDNKNIEIDFNGWVSKKPFEGIVGNLTRRFKETDSSFMREELSKYQRELPCPVCGGKRLSPKALCVKIHGKDIIDATMMCVDKAVIWFEELNEHLGEQQKKIAKPILKEINERLNFLKNVGLGYLTLSRMAGTLSGGESQRIRLASQIGSGLTGVLYVLDEPSIGLHQRDNDRLIQTLQALKAKDNTVIVVEHDEDMMRAADYLVDMGPRAGIHGGEITAKGTVKEVLNNKNSLTAEYLNGKRKIMIPAEKRPGNGNEIALYGASEHNLKNVDFYLPLGKLTCVTGVSGSGKSTLIHRTFYKALQVHLNNARITVGAHDKIEGLHHIDKVIEIDQSPIGRTPRSNPATYTGLFDPIRMWFSGLPEAKARGYSPGRFSFNVKGGRCEACQGDGQNKIEMHFLPDIYVECEQCKGKRYNDETLAVRYKGKSIADVLAMSIEEAHSFFENIPSIKRKLDTLMAVGLDYIKLGQSAITLSGGEAQRVKLAKELSRQSRGHTLYILDEPTTGLHFADIEKLLEVLHRFADEGHSVLVIEHNLDVIKTADHVIDLGPEGGDAGGQIIATGTPEQIAQNPNSYTGQYLKKVMG